MSLRLDYRRIGAKALEALMGVEQYLEKTGLDPKLRGLIYLRASQINGCAFCVNMHYGELKKGGRAGSAHQFGVRVAGVSLFQ